MTPEQRSRCMASIKSNDTKPEILVRKFLFSKGLRYRLHTGLPGKPDIVLPKWKTVVFIDGCFWHGHEGCRYFRLPKTNEDFWLKKITRNRFRDIRFNLELENLGWRVIRVWECQLRTKAMQQATLEELYQKITGTAKDEYPSIAAEPEAPYGE